MTEKATGFGDLMTLRGVVALERGISVQSRGGYQIARAGVRGEWMLREQAEICCFLSSGNEGHGKG